MQDPEEHVSPAPHEIPQPPQFQGSAAVFTHCKPQRAPHVPDAQVTGGVEHVPVLGSQIPGWHWSVDGQTVSVLTHPLLGSQAAFQHLSVGMQPAATTVGTGVVHLLSMQDDC